MLNENEVRCDWRLNAPEVDADVHRLIVETLQDCTRDEAEEAVDEILQEHFYLDGSGTPLVTYTLERVEPEAPRG